MSPSRCSKTRNALGSETINKIKLIACFAVVVVVVVVVMLLSCCGHAAVIVITMIITLLLMVAVGGGCSGGAAGVDAAAAFVSLRFSLGYCMSVVCCWSLADL